MSLPPLSLYDQTPDPDTGKKIKWHMTRAPIGGGSLGAVIVSPNPLQIRVHFIGSNTTPCLRTGCPYDATSESRLRFYALAIRARDSLNLILEVPPTGWAPIKLAAEKRGTYRGLCVRLYRDGPNRNSEVQSECVQAVPDTAQLPPAEDLWPILCAVFKLRKGKPGRTSESPLTVATQGETDQMDKAQARADRGVVLPAEFAPRPLQPSGNGDLSGQLRLY